MLFILILIGTRYLLLFITQLLFCAQVILRPIPSDGIQISKKLLVRMKFFCSALLMMIKMMLPMISDPPK